ncbi:Late embryogenesis abundant protein Lea5-D [Linum perenne]
MARSVATSMLLPASVSIFRRGYAATTATPLNAVYAAFARGGSAGKVVKEEKSAAIQDSDAASAWAPDPVTGYYRPGNSTDEIDPVELREMLLNNTGRSN